MTIIITTVTDQMAVLPGCNAKDQRHIHMRYSESLFHTNNLMT